MDKKKKEPLLIISGIFASIALISGVLLVMHLYSTFSSQEEVQHSSQEEIDFHYTLRVNATDFQIALHDELILAYENYKEAQTMSTKEGYAKAIVKNFIADFYTWSNKGGRTDVGGLQFIAPQIQSDFKRYAIDNFYLYLNQYIENHGAENLLTVSDITIEKILLNETFEIGVELDEETGDVIAPITEEVIKVEASWEYAVSPLNEQAYFQNKATFILTEERDRLVIRVIQETLEEQEIELIY